MKDIFLIETFPYGLDTIKSHLSDINAMYKEFSSVHDAIASDEVPALIVLLANKNLENYRRDLNSIKNNTSFSNIPRISLVPFRMSINTEKPEILKGEDEFRMPVDKLKFLSALAKILNIPARRILRIIISIQPERSSSEYSGFSLDFSETGMAFECRSDFPEGQNIIVTYVNPLNRKRITLNTEIVRKISTQTGDTIFYGVRFHKMTKQDRQDLKYFITGES